MSDRQLSPYSELMPSSLQEKVEMAKYLAQSDLMPGGLKTPAQVFVALQMGHELGLSPMVAVNNIAVINGRPSLSSAIMEAIARNHRDFAGIKITPSGEGEERTCKVEIKRKTGENIETFTGYYTLAMATEAGLYPGKKDNWDKYPERMLKARASGYAARDAFPDALAGMISYDEAEEIQQEPRDVTPEKSPPEIKKDGDNRDIPIEDLSKMLSPEELEAIDTKMVKVQKYINDNMPHLKADTVKFIDEHARDTCIRHFYRTGTEPTAYLEEMMNRMRKQVDAAKAKEKDTKAKAKIENGQQPTEGGIEKPLMDDVKRRKKVEDAEVIEEEDTEVIEEELDFGEETDIW